MINVVRSRARPPLPPAVILAGVLLGFVMLLGSAGPALASSSGDCFRTTQAGNWNATATWQSAPTAGGCTVWSAATLTPTSTASTITVSHTVHVTANVTIDQTTVASGGDLEIDTGVTLTINQGSGTADLLVNATAGVTGILAQANGGIGSYVEVGNGGTLTVYSGGVINGSGGSGATVSKLTVDNGGGWTINSGGSLNAGGASGMQITINSGGTATIDGSITQGTAMTVNGTLTSSASITLSSISDLEVGGSMTMTGGTLTVTRGNGGPVGSINSGGTLTLSGSSILAIGTIGTASFTVASGGTLAIGASALVNGGGLLSVASGGNLKIGSVDGITTGTTTGNVRTSGTDVYNTAANYTYNGTAAQITGSVLPATVNNLTINNSGGNVTLTNSVTVNGTLTLTSGDLVTGAKTVTQPSTASSSGTTDVVGDVIRTGFVSGGSALSFGNPYNTIQINSGTAPTSIDVKLVKSAPTSPAFSTAVTRTYTITPTGGSGYSATVQLHYATGDLNGNTESGLDLWKSNGSSWSDQGRTGAVDTTNHAVALSGVTSFSSAWTLAQASAAGPANFGLNIGAAAASTCTPRSITITARDSGNATLAGYTGTVTLTTSSSHGDWAVVTGAGTLNNGTADDGAATYTFAAGDNGVVTLSLTNTHADDLTITAVDNTVPASSTTSSTLNFRDNGFVITATDSLGTTAVGGRNHAMKVEMQNCSVVDTKYTGNKNLDAWYAADTDHPAGASAPTISSGTPPGSCGVAPSLALSTTVPASNAGSNNLANVPFSNGVWNFCLTTSDVGKYTIALRDDTRSYATAVDVSGASNTLTVRPFGIAITTVKKGSTNNPAGTATAGTKFIPAGNTAQAAAQFEATVTGYLWNAADDANNDGVPDGGANLIDNAVAPHFDWGTTLSAASTSPYFTPAAGTLGTLTGTTAITKGSYSSGSANVANLAYSEVGSFQLQAALTNYLNSAGVNLSGVNVDASGAATQIGRFYPDHFTLTASSLTAACVGGGFTYMDQPNLGVSYTLEARNTADAKVSNYGAGYTVGAVSMLAENADNGGDLSSRLTIASASWASGAYSVNTSNATLSRAATPDGPFDSLQLGVQVTDGDGAVLASPDMNPATAGACGGACTGKALSSTTKLRFGRLRLQNASGSQLISMPIPFEAQYWNGTAFVTNTADNCTSIGAANLALGNYQKNLAPGDTTVSVAVALAAGRGMLRLSAPGAAKNGSVDVSVNLTGSTAGASCTSSMPSSTGANLSYLQGAWCGATYNRDPTARATFGIYPDAIIYQRENF